MIDEIAMKNVIRPANRERNTYEYGKFKNFDSLVNNRAKIFTLALIKQSCAKHNITEHDDLIKQKEIEL